MIWSSKTMDGMAQLHNSHIKFHRLPPPKKKTAKKKQNCGLLASSWFVQNRSASQSNGAIGLPVAKQLAALIAMFCVLSITTKNMSEFHHCLLYLEPLSEICMNQRST